MQYDLSLGDSLFIDNKLDAALQELDILFDTENTELIGYPLFGTNFEQFLWQMNPSPESLKEYILEKIRNFTTFLYQYDVDITIEIIDGELRNIYNVLISITDDSGDRKHRIYQFR